MSGQLIIVIVRNIVIFKTGEMWYIISYVNYETDFKMRFKCVLIWYHHWNDFITNMNKKSDNNNLLT